MKKTLPLIALLSAVAAPLSAEDIWWQGIEATSAPNGGYALSGATATYKHNSGGTNPGDTPDYNMCWGVSAANQIAWWQEQMEQNGALIIPENCPRGNGVWEELRQMWQNQGYWVPMGIQHWLHGSENCGYIGTAEKSKVMTEQGLSFGGYFPRVAQANFFRESYIDTANGYHNETALINVLRVSGNNESTSYAGISAQVREMLQDGWSFTFSTSSTASNHAMTVFGFEFDDSTGLIDKFYYSDNNDMGVSKDKAFALGIYDGGTSGRGYSLMNAQGYGKIEYLYALRTSGIRFTDYDVRVGKNLVAEDESVFSHYCNLIVDGTDNFDLKYDLRDASAVDSPVTANIVTYLDEFNTEEVTNQMATTGDMRLRGGKVTLVNCAEGREKLDGGGSVEGSIIFEDSRVKGTETIQEANRTLKVDRTDTIAKEIKLDATLGTNTLEVTDDHIASFGKLTGKGNLTKTGSGTAEVTEALDLDGHVTVQNGYFLLGESATFSGNTTLTVASDGHVSAKGSESSITLTLNSGVHLNDGEMTLTTTVNTGATLKGSGSFGMVTVSGGDLIVGNSPGHQDYEGALTLNSGRMIFSVAGLDEAASLTSTGWESGTYSNIDMHDNAFTVGVDGRIVIALSQEAADSLTMGGGEFALALVSGMSNELSEEQLAALANQTTFQLSAEEGAGNLGRAALNTPQFTYQMSNGVLMLTSGVTDSGNVPEPATGTLSLLALAGLMARRRRK